MIFAVFAVPVIVMAVTLVLVRRERKANASEERLQGMLKLGGMLSLLSFIVSYMLVYLLFIKYFR